MDTIMEILIEIGKAVLLIAAGSCFFIVPALFLIYMSA